MQICKKYVLSKHVAMKNLEDKRIISFADDTLITNWDLATNIAVNMQKPSTLQETLLKISFFEAR